MSMDSFSLANYLQAPLAAELEGFPPEAAACFDDFFAAWCLCRFPQWDAVKQAKKRLVDTGCIEDFSLHLLRKCATTAYMKDGGKMYLSLGLVFGHSAMTLLSVYAHELAHILLSQREDYPAIKAMQRAFKQRYHDHPMVELMSPIEVYAMLLSRPLLYALAERANRRHKRKLMQLIRDLEEKLTLLEREIRQLPLP